MGTGGPSSRVRQRRDRATDGLRTCPQAMPRTGSAPLTAFLVVSLDGYFVGRDGAFDWPIVDDEFLEFSERQLRAAGRLAFGRVTFEGMAAHWRSSEAAATPSIASRMNDLPKFVVSRTLSQADWPPSTIVRDPAFLRDAAAFPEGGETLILGSPQLVGNLLEAGLLDELRLMVNPILLGGGGHLSGALSRPTRLRLERVTPFRSGNVLVSYQPADRR